MQAEYGDKCVDTSMVRHYAHNFMQEKVKECNFVFYSAENEHFIYKKEQQ